MNILPPERPNPNADKLAAAVVAGLQQFPTLHRRVTALLVGPAFDALDAAFAANLEVLRQELNLMGDQMLRLVREKDDAETKAATYELRATELQGGDDVIAAVRNLYRRRETLLTQRLQRIDINFAKCRDEKRALQRAKDELEKQLAEAARERTGAARYIVQLEDRIRELENEDAA